jgi:hypothetical protein
MPLARQGIGYEKNTPSIDKKGSLKAFNLPLFLYYAPKRRPSPMSRPALAKSLCEKVRNKG